MKIKIFLTIILSKFLSAQNHNHHEDPVDTSVMPGIMVFEPLEVHVSDEPIPSKHLDENDVTSAATISRDNSRGPLDQDKRSILTLPKSGGAMTNTTSPPYEKEGKELDIFYGNHANFSLTTREESESFHFSSSDLVSVNISDDKIPELNLAEIPSNFTNTGHGTTPTTTKHAPKEYSTEKADISTTIINTEITSTSMERSESSIAHTTETTHSSDLTQTTNIPKHYHDFEGGHSHFPRSEEHRDDRDADDIEDEPLNEDMEDLCLSCLCDQRRLNVYCKHDHLSSSSLHHIKLRASMIPKTATFLHIQGFETVTITRGTFSSEDLELRSIHFENIKNVRLPEESLLFNEKASTNREVAVRFENCNMKEMPRNMLTQYARSEDQNSDIDLEKTRFLTLDIIGCNITYIRSSALTKARLLYFTMSQTRVEEMEEHSFHVDIYEDWIMDNNHFPMLMPHTICLRSQMLVIFSKNTFLGLNNRSIEVISHNQVLFEHNRVHHLGPEALIGIRPQGRGANLVFMNNTVYNLEDRSLLINKMYPAHERKILNNYFNVGCDCNIRGTFQPLMGITNLSDHYENETFNKLLEHSSCKGNAVYVNIEEYLADHCASVPLPIIVSAGIVVVVILITVIVCLVCNRRAEKAKEEANYLGECCYSHSFSTLNSGNPNMTSPPFSECGSWERPNQIQPWVIGVPEVKTYQETEMTVQYEQTDPLNASVRGSYTEPTADFQRLATTRASCPFN